MYNLKRELDEFNTPFAPGKGKSPLTGEIN